MGIPKDQLESLEVSLLRRHVRGRGTLLGGLLRCEGRSPGRRVDPLRKVEVEQFPQVIPKNGREFGRGVGGTDHSAGLCEGLMEPIGEKPGRVFRFTVLAGAERDSDFPPGRPRQQAAEAENPAFGREV